MNRNKRGGEFDKCIKKFMQRILQKKEGAGDEGARRWKERLEQVLATGVKPPELRHLFQELAFSHAAVTRVSRSARRQFIEKSAGYLVSRAYFE